jgi:hypothetical protein
VHYPPLFLVKIHARTCRYMQAGLLVFLFQINAALSMKARPALPCRTGSPGAATVRAPGGPPGRGRRAAAELGAPGPPGKDGTPSQDGTNGRPVPGKNSTAGSSSPLAARAEIELWAPAACPAGTAPPAPATRPEPGPPAAAGERYGAREGAHSPSSRCSPGSNPSRAGLGTARRRSLRHTQRRAPAWDSVPKRRSTRPG